MNSLSEFCLSMLLPLYQNKSPLFDTVYNKLCTTLCNVDPLSLMDQPTTIQKLYTQILAVLSELSSNSK